MNKEADGRGPGIYAWKDRPGRRSTKTVVKVLLYGRVIEYASSQRKGFPRREAGFMAERAEIIEEV